MSFELFHQVGVGVSTLAPPLELHLTPLSWMNAHVVQDGQHSVETTVGWRRGLEHSHELEQSVSDSII